MAKTPARDSSANSKRPLHLSGLADESGPPFLRFERDEGEQGERFFVWVAAPLTIDTDALHAAIQGDVEARGGVVRVLLEHFAYELSATEASLLARYEAKDTGPDFWREVEAADYEVVDAPDRRMRWGVGDPTVHDDMLLSAALCALLDGAERPPYALPGVIEARDPLAPSEQEVL